MIPKQIKQIESLVNEFSDFARMPKPLLKKNNLNDVIKENISGNGVDTSVLEAEMSKLAYQFSLEMTSVVEKHLPNILEAIANEIRLKADSTQHIV